jgi:hypothetical protein
MRKKTVLMSLVAALFVVGMLFTQATFAQETTPGTQQQPGWAIDTPLAYTERIPGDAPVITITGKISNIGKMRDFKEFMEFTLKSSEPFQMWKVWVGPRWFVMNQKVQFNVGDEVEVRGLKYRTETIIASEISKGDLTMLLRSESDGMPNWKCCVPRVRGEK